jgi:hypothetical protein
MPEQHLFEYAVIRVVPRVEREEFINVGVILYCAKQKFLQVIIFVNEHKLLSIAPGIELDVIKENLQAIVNICKGESSGGPIGRLDMVSRFRWLTATRSTVVQASKVHPGFCKDAEETLKKLAEQLVF